jgi:hypothetical protein
MSETEDDFQIFGGQEHMFFGIANPYEFIRYEIEEALRNAPPHLKVEQIAAYGNPKWVTLVRQADAGGNAPISHYGVSFKAKLIVSHPQALANGVVDVVMTFFFGNIDRPEPRKKSIFDLKNTEHKFRDELFTERFIAFRLEVDSEDDVETDSRETELRKPWWKWW